MVPAALAVPLDLREAAGRLGILSTGDWTLIAGFENGGHTSVDDAIVMKLLDSWRLRSTPGGAVLGVPENITIDSSEVDFGRIPDLTDTAVDLVQTARCQIGATPKLYGVDPDVTALWCAHGLVVSIEGPTRVCIERCRGPRGEDRVAVRGFSVVVPAHNEERLLPNGLRAIELAADRGDVDVEVIVVANRCTDATVELARAAGAIVVEDESRNISAVRNAGAAVATRGSSRDDRRRLPDVTVDVSRDRATPRDGPIRRWWDEGHCRSDGRPASARPTR